jgi:signal transduction histidine kinase
MMNQDQNNPNSQGATEPQNNITNELSHITEEIYKKNAELAHTNKVLSLLRKIDDIVLGSVTDLGQVAQQVVSWVVKEDSFKIVSILIVDKKDNSVSTLAASQLGADPEAEARTHQKLIDIKISLEGAENGIIKSIKERREQIVENLYEVYAPLLTENEAKQMAEIYAINSTVIYPLIVREVVIGVMVISRVEGRAELSLYEKDLLDRLASVVGIAMDNSLMYKEISDTNEKLKELDKLKDEFVSIASHELRTPMTIIKGYAWRMLTDEAQDKLSEKNRQRLESIYESTEREIALINDILNVSRIEAGTMEYKPQVFDVVKLTQDIANDMTGSFLDKKIALTVGQGSFNVKADENNVRQILVNLLTNAFKFTNQDGRITVEFATNEKFVLVSVTDTGVGIQQSDLPKLFTKFGKLDSPLSSTYQSTGTGLGLYLCKKLVEIQGGRIEAESEVGKGTKFTFSLEKAS